MAGEGGGGVLAVLAQWTRSGQNWRGPYRGSLAVWKGMLVLITIVLVTRKVMEMMMLSGSAAPTSRPREDVATTPPRGHQMQGQGN